MSLEYNILELSLLDVFTGNSNESKLFGEIFAFIAQNGQINVYRVCV